MTGGGQHYPLEKFVTHEFPVDQVDNAMAQAFDIDTCSGADAERGVAGLMPSIELSRLRRSSRAADDRPFYPRRLSGVG
jgi:hypothetical protein